MNDEKPWLEEWENEQPLSGGGQGITSVMQHKLDSQRKAVLKRIVERWRHDPQARERLKQETETLARLHALGAKVPIVYDSSNRHENSEPFLLMEFISGDRFDHWLKTSAPVSPETAVTISHGIAETVKLCHQHQIGHRDLKPANIILKGGRPDSPYVLDFGISFDSRQTVVLTEAGEMFWNEFIVLPECQDLNGGHRDLRSDITALAGLFFMCMTGKAPIVLRDAQEASPHKRHEALLRKAGKTTEQAERLIWFFDRAFAYRISERFQNLDEFLKDLNRVSDAGTSEQFNFREELNLWDKTLHLKNRGVQVAVLRETYSKFKTKLFDEANRRMNTPPGGLQTMGLSIANGANPSIRPNLIEGDILDSDTVATFLVRRPNYDSGAVVIVTAFGVGMQIHVYSASYGVQVSLVATPRTHLRWEKVAVIDEQTVSPQNIDVVVKSIESGLARIIRGISKELTSG